MSRHEVKSVGTATLQLLFPPCRFGSENNPGAQVRRVSGILIVALLVGVTEFRSEAQEPRPKFRAGVALVPITAVVRDNRGRLVRDLTKDDFEVLENGQPRPLVEFKSTDHAPISLALLLDTSGSMREANLNRAKSLVGTLLATLDRSSDETALFTFDKTLREETPFTSNPEDINRALDRTAAWGLTSLYDAIAATAKRVAERPTQRRAIVVVTDGIDTSSTMSSEDASGLASSVDVPVYVLTVAAPRRPLIGEDETLANLARWTGGIHIAAHDAVLQDGMISGLVAELRQLYFLAIESAPTPIWHRLDVKTKRPRLNVRARSGYFGKG